MFSVYCKRKKSQIILKLKYIYLFFQISSQFCLSDTNSLIIFLSKNMDVIVIYFCLLIFHVLGFLGLLKLNSPSTLIYENIKP